MLSYKSRAWVAGGWFAGCVFIAAGAVALGAPLTTGLLELVLTACLVPPAVMLLIWRGAPAPTVAEVLHGVDDGTAPRRGGPSIKAAARP